VKGEVESKIFPVKFSWPKINNLNIVDKGIYFQNISIMYLLTRILVIITMSPAGIDVTLVDGKGSIKFFLLSFKRTCVGIHFHKSH
jgi:hypothetical protein